MSRFLILISGLLSFSSASLHAQSVRVQVIDVGQADGILIRTPNHEWILIDAGAGASLAAALAENFGVDRLALSIASHRHRDHVGGMDEVIELIDTDLFIGDTTDVPGRTFDDDVRDALGDDVPVQLPAADTLEVDGVRFIVLPRAPYDEDNENNNSVVVRLDYGEFSMLFTGDAENAERDWLVENSSLLDVDVLKASHHGSHNGTSPEWLDAVTPSRVVISAGLHRGFKHPHAEAVTAYLAATDGRLYCTNRHGTIRIYGYLDGHIQVSRQRQTTKSCSYDGTHY